MAPRVRRSFRHRDSIGARSQRHSWSVSRSSPRRRVEATAETIEAALARAYENNPQLNAQRAIVRQTDENVPQALSGYRPTITANATVGRQYTDTKNIIPPTPALVPNGAAFSDRGLTTPAFGRRLPLSQTSSTASRPPTRSGRRKARFPRRARRYASWKQSVLLAAATVYMDMSRDSANLEVQQNNVRVLQRTLQDTRNRFAAGQVTDDRRRAVGSAIGGRRSHHARRRIDADDDARQLPAHHRRRAGEPRPASAVDRLAPSTLNAAIAVGTVAESERARGLVRRRCCATAGQDRGRRAVADADRAVQRPAADLSPASRRPKCTPTR